MSPKRLARITGVFYLITIVAAIGLLGSLATIMWLLVFGVNQERWTEEARATEGMLVS